MCYQTQLSSVFDGNWIKLDIVHWLYCSSSKSSTGGIDQTLQSNLFPIFIQHGFVTSHIYKEGAFIPLGVDLLTSAQKQEQLHFSRELAQSLMKEYPITWKVNAFFKMFLACNWIVQYPRILHSLGHILFRSATALEKYISTLVLINRPYINPIWSLTSSDPLY